MRPVELAREHGLSTQAVRNYERAGVLPPAVRTASGHRVYTARHASALRAFLAMVPGHGHATARAIMAAVVEGRVDEALVLVDRSHADLLEQRRTLDAVERALGELTTVPVPRHPDTGLPIGAVAHQLRLGPATLRKWEAAGLLRPQRDRFGHRTYAAVDVRDAHLVAQLRRSGYPLARIAPLLTELRDAADPTAVAAAMVERRRRLDVMAMAMLGSAGLLHAHLADAPGAPGATGATSGGPVAAGLHETAGRPGTAGRTGRPPAPDTASSNGGGRRAEGGPDRA